jgi:hypothetical protein
MTRIDLRGSYFDSTGYQPIEEVENREGEAFQRVSMLIGQPQDSGNGEANTSTSSGDLSLLQWANQFYSSNGGPAPQSFGSQPGTGGGGDSVKPLGYGSGGDGSGGPLGYGGGGAAGGGGSTGGGSGPLGLGGSGPVVTSTDQEVVEYEVLQGVDILKATDADGTIQRFKFRDSVGGGWFELAGTKLAEGKTHSIKANQLDQLVYRATTKLKKKNPLFIDQVRIKARDNDKNWSVREDIEITNINNWNAPIVYTANKELSTSESLLVSKAFHVRDEDQNTIKRYEVRDLTPGSGYITYKGAVVTKRRFKAKFLDELVFHSADDGGVDAIRIGAFDGQFWGYRDFTVTTIARPVLDVVDTQILDQLEERSLSSMILQADSGPAPTKYQIYDSNGDPLSAAIIDGIDRLEAGVVHEVTAEQLRGLMVKGGFYDDRSLDEFYIRMNNGRDWGQWEKLTIRTEPHYLEALMRPGWDDFITRDSSGRLIVTYSFLQKVPDYYASGATERQNFLEYNDSMREGARRALAVWQSVTNITFVEVPDPTGGVIRFGTADLPDNVGAWAYLPGSSTPMNQGLPGDVWLNNNGYPDNAPLGPSSWAAHSNQAVSSWGFFVHLHELGHANGLMHPFDVSVLPKLPPATDNTSFSVMSYTDYSNFINDIGGTEKYASTPMIYDIAAMEAIYGAQPNNNDGDTVYQYGAGIDDAVLQTIYDTSGVDTLDASNQFRGVEIDLAPGSFSSIGRYQRATITMNGLVDVTTNAEDNIGIAFSTTIENAVGSLFDDVIHGNNVDNDIRGGWGADEMDGRDGDDYLSGQRGDDIYKVTVANGSDTLADEGNASDVDVLEVRSHISTALGLDDFTKDLTFSVDGDDLYIHFDLNDGVDRQDSIQIAGQLTAGEANRIETLRLLDEAGNVIAGGNISLVSISSVATSTEERFTLTGASDAYGQIAVQV